MALIIFDFDGVLADTLDDLVSIAQAVCEELGIDRIVTPADLDSLEIMSFVGFGRQLGIPPHMIDEFVNRCFERFVQGPRPIRIFEGMKQIVGQLAKNHTIAIVTGNTTQTVENFLDAHDLRKDVGTIFAVDQPGSKPEKILSAQRQLAGDGEQVYIVGDAVSDIRAAREASVKSIAVSWGHQSLIKLMGAKPDHLVHSPRELLELLDKYDQRR